MDVQCSKTQSFLLTHRSSATILLVYKLFYAEASRIMCSENFFCIAEYQQTLLNIVIDTVLADSAMNTSLSFKLPGICGLAVDDGYALRDRQVPTLALARRERSWGRYLATISARLLAIRRLGAARYRKSINY